MSAPKHQFIGFMLLRVSPKRNVQLPAMWKRRLAGPMLMRRSHKSSLPCIQVISQAILEAEHVDKNNGANRRASKDQVKAILSEECRQVYIGFRARMTLPRTWCDESAIAYPGLVIVAGRGPIFELWNPENFDEILEQEVGPGA